MHQAYIFGGQNLLKQNNLVSFWPKDVEIIFNVQKLNNSSFYSQLCLVGQPWWPLMSIYANLHLATVVGTSLHHASLDRDENVQKLLRKSTVTAQRLTVIDASRNQKWQCSTWPQSFKRETKVCCGTMSWTTVWPIKERSKTRKKESNAP